MIGSSKPWRYGPIYGGETFSDRQVLRKVRRLLARRVWVLQVRITRYSMVSAPPPQTREARDRSVHPLAALPYYQVTHGLTSAVDHLVGLRALVSARRAIPAYSAYTLIRASLEGSLGAWRLLDPDNREAAFVEALARWTREARYSTQAMRAALTTEESQTWASTQRLIAELGGDDVEGAHEEAVKWATQEARRLGWLKPNQNIPRPATATSNFEALDPNDPQYGRTTYNILSGGAHGQPWAAETLAWPRDLIAERAFFRTVRPKLPFIHQYAYSAVHWAETCLGRAEEFKVIPLQGENSGN